MVCFSARRFPPSHEVFVDTRQARRTIYPECSWFYHSQLLRVRLVIPLIVTKCSRPLRVAVYLYGLFDDSTNPIYTITIDDGAPVEQGRGTNADPQNCAPIYSKTGLTAANHTVVFKMTSVRPGDVKDLSFQGFM